MESFNGWCPYGLREIDDAEKRAAICGVGVDEVRKGVKAILLKSVCLNTEPSLRDGAMGASREDGAARTANASCTSRTRKTLAAEKIEFRQTPYDLVLGR